MIIVTEVIDDSYTHEYSVLEEVETAIFDNIHGRRFYSAEQAPICQGSLRGDFGYMADTLIARQVLNGTYHYPEDFHQGKKEILQECARF